VLLGGCVEPVLRYQTLVATRSARVVSTAPAPVARHRHATSRSFQGIQTMAPIFVVLTILVLVSLDLLLAKRRGHRTEEEVMTCANLEAAGEVGAAVSLPQGLFLSRGHSWAEVLADGSVRVGMDEVVAEALGVPGKIVLPSSGDRVLSGEPLLTIENGGKRLRVPSPISGTVESINDDLAAHPSLVSDAPYGGGWACCIRASQLGSEIRELRIAETAVTWLKEEVNSFVDWLRGGSFSTAPAAIQDGGKPVSGSLAQLDQDAWTAFETEFLGLRPQQESESESQA